MSTVKEMRRELNVKELDGVVGGELSREVQNLIEDWMEQDYVNGSTKEEEMNSWILMGLPEEAEYVDKYWDRMVERHKFFFGDN